MGDTQELLGVERVWSDRYTHSGLVLNCCYVKGSCCLVGGVCVSGMEDSKGFCVAEEVLSCRLFTVSGPGLHLVTNQWDHKLQNQCNDFTLIILRSTLTSVFHASCQGIF